MSRKSERPPQPHTMTVLTDLGLAPRSFVCYGVPELHSVPRVEPTSVTKPKKLNAFLNKVLRPLFGVNLEETGSRTEFVVRQQKGKLLDVWFPEKSDAHHAVMEWIQQVAGTVERDGLRGPASSYKRDVNFSMDDGSRLMQIHGAFPTVQPHGDGSVIVTFMFDWSTKYAGFDDDDPAPTLKRNCSG